MFNILHHTWDSLENEEKRRDQIREKERERESICSTRDSIVRSMRDNFILITKHSFEFVSTR